MKNKFVQSETQTYSKQAKRYVKGIYPETIESANGCFVYDGQGNCYIDYISALGANLLGYAHPYVNEKVKERMDKGTIFSMSSPLEEKLAEKLNSLFPCMETMRFLKSGSEAVSAAVKLARAYTKRELIISIGYHGWHDWSSASSPKNAGCPERIAPLCINVEYNDLQTLKDLFKLDGEDICAVVLEPYVFDEPSNDYLRELIKLAHKHGALVIFDEVVTGIRWQEYGVTNYYELQPDLLCLGKPIANGFPMAVVGGRRRIMEELDKDCFVSSTFGGDLVGISGALATLYICESEDVQDMIFEAGEDLKNSYNEIAKSLGIKTDCYGNPCRLNFRFPTDTHKALFWQESLLRGVMFGYCTQVTLAHNSAIINQTINVINKSLTFLKENWEAPEKMLRGLMPERVEVVGARR